MNAERKFPQIEPDECELAVGEKILIHLFRPEDAPGIGRLFQAVYGDHYPVRHFYNPEQLAKALETGQNYSIVARKEGGDIVGHMALFRSSPYPGVYECGAGLVLPEYRQGGISLSLLHYTFERLATGLGLEETWGEAVCNHVHMQKAVGRTKHVETGLEIDLMPAEAYAREKSSSGRVTSLLVFRSYVSKPHMVYLPGIYENDLRSIYSGLDDERKLDVSSELPPDGIHTGASFEVFDFAQVARVAVTAIGQDFESFFTGMENRILTGKINVIQVWVNLSCPWVGYAVDVLRRRGYFMGGILARWFDADALLMQKIMERPNWEGIRLFSNRAEAMLRMVRKDWEQVTPLCSQTRA